MIPIPPKKSKENITDLPEANSKNIEFIDVPDFNVRVKYLDMALKLKGKYPAQGIDIKHSGEIDTKMKYILEMEEGELDKFIEAFIERKARIDTGADRKEEKGNWKRSLAVSKDTISQIWIQNFS